MPNIALVVLDTLRKDAFDAHFDWLPGKRFQQARSPSHWTVPVHAGLFTGHYASELGVYAGSEHLNCPEQTVAEALREAGYTTRGFSCNPFLTSEFNFDRGFDEFTGSWRIRSFDSRLFDWNHFISQTRDEGPTRYFRALWECLQSDCATVDSLRFGAELKLRDAGIGGPSDDGAQSALKWIEDTEFESDEFLFLNLMEAHTPYDPPPEYRTVECPDFGNMLATVQGTDVESDVVEQAYHDSVRYLSDMYEQIYAELITDFDLIVTVSDHGELFGEHGVWEHSYGVYPELTHVPLVLSGDYTGADSDTVVSLLDVYPTVLDAAELESDRKHSQSLLQEPADRSVISEYHGLQPRKRTKLIDAGIAKSTIERYDESLRGIALPPDYYGYESLDGFVESGTAAEDDPEARLRELVADMVERSAETSETVSETVTGQLEDLGYM